MDANDDFDFDAATPALPAGFKPGPAPVGPENEHRAAGRVQHTPPRGRARLERSRAIHLTDGQTADLDNGRRW